MSRFVVLVVVAAPAVPATAHARWSKPMTFPAVRARDTGAQLAINARGDAVALWTSRKPVRLRATLLRANGTRTTRTVTTRPNASGAVVALDNRGAATAAWIANVARSDARSR